MWKASRQKASPAVSNATEKGKRGKLKSEAAKANTRVWLKDVSMKTAYILF